MVGEGWDPLRNSDVGLAGLFCFVFFQITQFKYNHSSILPRSGAEDVSVALSRTTGVLAACCELSDIDELVRCAHPLVWTAVFIDSEAGGQHAHTYPESNRQVLLMSTSFPQTV